MEKTLKIEKRLENLTCLKEKVAVYVPSTVDVDKKINNEFYVNQVLTKFSEIFGGATAINVDGAWMSKANGLVLEKNIIIYSYCDNLTNENVDKVLSICEWLKSELKQEAISLVVNNQLYFI